MKYSLDLNIFLYATDVDSAFHSRARKFLDVRITGAEECFLVWDTIYGFLRIATHPTIFGNPLSPQIAMANITSALEALGATVISPDETSWDIYKKLCDRFAIRGKLVPDAVLASVLEAHGVSRLYTHDRDFWKFPYLKPVDPLLASD